MNYRHAYHAGNFADVVKHAILARVLTYMKQKPQPFRVIDTHAGSGRYDLGGIEASKTNEWRDGIERLIDADMPAYVAALLAPYLDAVRSVNQPGELASYPGSPLIAHFLMRPGDQLVANELHGDDLEKLKSEFHRVDGTKVLGLDAWVAVKALLPPPERRGVILIDPPFESPDEFERLTESLGHALRRFANGVYLVWYPVKDQAASNRFVREVSQLGCSKMLDVRLSISEPFAGLGLTETGLLILNPPFSLKSELEVLLPFLSERLAEGRGAGFRLADAFTAPQDIV
jgi:23S rRNA (adenine2030-N6)-methyltransferase